MRSDPRHSKKWVNRIRDNLHKCSILQKFSLKKNFEVITRHKPLGGNVNASPFAISHFSEFVSVIWFTTEFARLAHATGRVEEPDGFHIGVVYTIIYVHFNGTNVFPTESLQWWSVATHSESSMVFAQLAAVNFFGKVVGTHQALVLLDSATFIPNSIEVPSTR